MLQGNYSNNDAVKEAELRLAAFISEHNISFRVMDHLSDLLPKLCPDSKIAANVRCKRTKTKSIITNAMAPHFHSNLVSKLKSNHFSLIIDETTDISTKKELALVIRQYDIKEKAVKCCLYELVELAEGNAETLFQVICKVLENDEIPLSNMLGFAADTTNIMFGQHNSVVSRLQQAIPSIFILRCICHSAHLCASHACEKLPRTAEDLIHDIYNYFSHSAKRQSDFKKFQHFAEVEPYRLLRPCQTRWLSLNLCVDRLIEQWNALKLYFESTSKLDNLLASQRILSQMQNPIWILYLQFLSFVLPKFTNLNLMFQSSKMSLHCLSRGLSTVYKEFLSCYMIESSWRHKNLTDIDPESEVHFLPITSMYMGAKVSLLLTTAEYTQRSRTPDVQHFLKKVREFFIEAACQIRKRFPIGDPVIEMLEVLDPNITKSKFPSLVPLAVRFPNLVSEENIQTLDDEWRRLVIEPLPFDHKNMEPEEFWAILNTVKDGSGEYQFPNLCAFMSSLLSLPHANVDVERVFSSVNLIKTKSRNRLHTSTVRALLKTKDGIKASGGCTEFTPPRVLNEMLTTDRLYSSIDLDLRDSDD